MVIKASDITKRDDLIEKLQAQLRTYDINLGLSMKRVAELEAQVVDAILDCSKLHVQNVKLQAQLADAEEACRIWEKADKDAYTSWRNRAEKAESQLAEKDKYITQQQLIIDDLQKFSIDEQVKYLQAKLAEAQEIIVCLKTDMPMADRLLNQRGTINRLEAQLAEYHKQIPHLLRFVPPQNHDPLCRLHNDAVDYLLESIKGEES